MNNVNSADRLQQNHFGDAIQNFAANHPEHVHALASIYEHISPHLTKENIETTAKNWIKAKALPLSSPAGIDEEIKQVKKKLKRLILIKKATINNLNACTSTMAQLSQTKTSPSRLAILQRQKNDYENRLKGLLIAIKRDEIYLKHLKIKKGSHISGRFADMAGSVADFVVPGSGTLAKMTLTATTMAVPVKSAVATQNPKEIKTVRNGALLATLGFVAVTAAKYYIWPTVQQVASQIFKFS